MFESSKTFAKKILRKFWYLSHDKLKRLHSGPKEAFLSKMCNLFQIMHSSRIITALTGLFTCRRASPDNRAGPVRRDDLSKHLHARFDPGRLPGLASNEQTIYSIVLADLGQARSVCQFHGSGLTGLAVT